MHYFLDTEFADLPDSGMGIDFISIGLVTLDGRSFYGVSNTIDEQKYKGHWLEQNVLAKLPLPEQRQSLTEIKAALLALFAPPTGERAPTTINIWAHNGSYDFYVLCRIFGGQLALRKALHDTYGIEKTTFRDMKELRPHQHSLPMPAPQNPATEHIAIADAQHERLIFLALRPELAKPATPPAFLSPKPR